MKKYSQDRVVIITSRVRTILAKNEKIKVLDLLKKFIRLPSKEEAKRIIQKSTNDDLEKAYKYLPTLKEDETKKSFNLKSIQKYIMLLASIAVLSGGFIPKTYADDTLADLVKSVKTDSQSNIEIGSIIFSIKSKIDGKTFKAKVAISSDSQKDHGNKYFKENPEKLEQMIKIVGPGCSVPSSIQGNIWVMEAELDGDSWGKNECEIFADKLKSKYEVKKILDEKTPLPNEIELESVNIHPKGKPQLFTIFKINGNEASTPFLLKGDIGESAYPKILEIFKSKGIAKKIDGYKEKDNEDDKKENKKEDSDFWSIKPDR